MGLFDRLRRKRIAILINLVRLRATGSRSPVRAHHTGDPPGSLDAACASGPWDPPRLASGAMWSAAAPDGAVRGWTCHL
jgi:hypothetical protein